MVAAVMSRVKKNEKGFTLIELLAVIVILGIIAAIAIPLISNVISKSRDDADVATARQIVDAARLYVTSELNGDVKSTTINIKTDLIDKNYLSNTLALPSTKDVITGGTVQYTNGELTEITITTAKGSVKYDASFVKSIPGTPDTE